MGVSVLGISFLLIGCTANTKIESHTIVLFSSFEGRYHDVGYQALYASQLALMETNAKIDVLAIDVGGTVVSAINRAHAVNLTEGVIAVVAVGLQSTTLDVLETFARIPVFVPENWGQVGGLSHVFYFANPQGEELTQSPVGGVPINGEVFFSSLYTLPSFYRTLDNIDSIQIVTSARLPDDNFRSEYLSLGEFVPEPTLIATHTLDVFRYIIEQPLKTINLTELSQSSDFVDGYFVDAPLFTYSLNITTGELETLDLIIE